MSGKKVPLKKKSTVNASGNYTKPSLRAYIKEYLLEIKEESLDRTLQGRCRWWLKSIKLKEEVIHRNGKD